MSVELSPALLAQIFSQESNDPFLTLLTLTHESIDTVRLVNNTKDITSRGEVFQAFPMQVRMPVDDGETTRSFQIEFDNVSLLLIEAIRTVTTPIKVKLEMVLASMPDAVQISHEDLEIKNISYNKRRVTATIILDNFLNTEVTSEKYFPSNFPGLF